MRKTQCVSGIIMLLGLIGTGPARADYPWCIQNSEFGYPGECTYQTHEQCLASLSGRKGYCGENPSVLFKASAEQQHRPQARQTSKRRSADLNLPSEQYRRTGGATRCPS